MAKREKLVRQIGEELNVLLATSRAVMAASSAAFDPDMQPAAYRVAVVISLQGSASASQLVQRLEMDKSAISRLTKSLCDRGLVTSSADPLDGRGTLYALTPEGAARVASAAAVKATAFYSRLEGWREEELALFSGLLRKFTH
ncbi:MarR family winged helix-turn-helix transcriptional regulator [Xanthomonas campestris]|uniref:MarR family winged helix-turn-helix transcriptional regulator n=1 Tax=Xanthomonas campestris TaxID=339 RepID=UPI001E2EBD30|nr:MarR family winged helix-turn-helix transcriptional regulator [Xanthomonas campestris]MCC5083034.1 MarR family winged helix-turn-helix transcriptional regulator [Xanthomonas campestris]MCW1979141.1 DNA-binding MarR family transcriptional regulator [Xanthomonas campestris]